ncbi:MAG: RdgB/HAM1 family non-canonical purine NTP pyrophosphatase [Candidatus Marinimicrobia bacterium]|nr:RdgB/HAM1 family non-canonical purine NTP pyrophosphatase [Candidatus Neomarinimicrobiota bacterium]
MSRRKTLVLATHNIHKQTEMKFILSRLGVTVIGLDQFPEIKSIEETGTTLIENALIKARTVHELTGLPSLADDTGLEVDALNGAPGVYSARFAGEDATFEDNVNKMLIALKGIPFDKRRARFRTVLAFVDSDSELSEDGVIEGSILNKARGKDGFGYDPIFQPKSYDITFAEMTSEEKNRISHRARALDKMKKILKTYFEKGEFIE